MWLDPASAGMILSTVNLSSSAEKRTEVFQTLASMALMVRKAKGCLRCQFCQESEDDTAFTLIEEWRSRDELDEHLQSQVFGALLGLTPLLQQPLGLRICTGEAMEGMEAVRRARGQTVAAALPAQAWKESGTGVLRRIARAMRGRIHGFQGD
jgi:quinol monooxygenase YgiN